MRGVVLLCVLHTVLGYTWDPPGPNTPRNPGSVCKTDEGTCGCCLMQQRVAKMSEYFNHTLNELEKLYQQANKCLSNMEASRIAFSVALSSSDRMRCIGPFSSNSLIVYQHVFLNLGGAYNSSTGVFRVPRSGVYSVALTIFSDGGAPEAEIAACAGLHVNGEVVAGARDRNMQDQEDSSTIAVALSLRAGDRVAVNLPMGCFLCDNNSHFNTFSAFLLYSTE